LVTELELAIDKSDLRNKFERTPPNYIETSLIYIQKIAAIGDKVANILLSDLLEVTLWGFCLYR